MFWKQTVIATPSIRVSTLRREGRLGIMEFSEVHSYSSGWQQEQVELSRAPDPVCC